nr:hypothetical protein [Cytophagales bacterium]
MCLIAINWLNHPDYKMVLVANRDEYYRRESSPLHFWEQGIYAGKDLEGGGTWLGVHPNGRFAALTNYRDVTDTKKRPTSRGELVTGYLHGDLKPLDYLRSIQEKKESYSGFNLLVSDGAHMFCFSNYQRDIQEVVPGCHALSNALLNTPWPKVQSARIALAGYLQQVVKPDMDTMIGLLSSNIPAPLELRPNTGLSPQWEESVSAQFIMLDGYYGTVNSTALLWAHSGEVHLKEVRFVPERKDTEIKFSMKNT